MTSAARSVLVVDDSTGTRRALSEWLREFEGEVVRPENSQSALSMIGVNDKGRPVHGVLLDLHMQGVSGMVVLEELGKRHSGIPAIVMANSDKSDEEWAAMRRGAHDSWVKPLTATLVRHTCVSPFLERDNPD